ncbi:HEPN domain-containing protein [Leptospira sp. SA-E8]|uniref:HEPN domain-containing protein n=1 Tax=Leptospira sp. SA-E8 TaxID=3422259 RepID=UPI003EC01C3B
MLTELHTSFIINITRVNSLFSLYTVILSQNSQKQGRVDWQLSDLLRAATVFLYATLEDFIRSILKWRLPEQKGTSLNRVPLKGLNSNGHPEKFYLGRLEEFRDLTVSELIRDSVHEFVNRSSFSSTDDIASILESVGIDLEELRSFFPTLQELIVRRHNIVHRADRNDRTGSGHHHVKSIGRHHVNIWIKTVDEFCNKLIQQLS